jgi:1-acyl-sn-glycerol-3-phosphate acyltransferase
MLRQRVARLAFRAAGWRMVGEVPRTGILVGAPHTSNWDFVLMLMVMWHGGVPPRVLVKQELFRGPLGWVMRWLGGIPVDRRNPAGFVRSLADSARADEEFLLIIAAEGTRKKAEYWKSGFYRIAQQAGLPLALAFVDGPTKTTGFGPTLVPTGDVEADMAVIRAFYADKRGVHPVLRTEPRLREERGEPGVTPTGAPTT